jgi:hypothetical protein
VYLIIIPDNCFQACVQLSEIKLPPNITTIMPKALEGILSLISVTMGEFLELVHPKAFSNNYLTFEGLNIFPNLKFQDAQNYLFVLKIHLVNLFILNN